MSTFDALLSKRLNLLLSGMYTCTLAKIIKVDMKYMRCDVQPLFDDEAKPIVDVPFGMHQHDEFLIRFPYRKGDIVFLAFCKEDMAPVLFEDGNREMAADGLFREDDAFVIGGVNLFTKPLENIPPDHDESFLICRKDFNTRIEIDKNGKIIVETKEQDIDVKTDKNINFEVLQGTFKVRAKDIDMLEV